MPSFKALLTSTVAAFTLFASTASAQEREGWLEIDLHKSVVLQTPQTPISVAITDPNIIGVQNLGVGRKYMIQGNAIGTTDLIVQYGPGIPEMRYEVTVHRDLTELIRRIDSLVEGEAPRVYPLEDRLVVEGPVDDLDTLERVAQVAQIFDKQFVNLMSVRGDHQVQLEVLFAEVQRKAVRELGINVLWGAPNLGAGLTNGGNSGTQWTHAPLQTLLGQGASVGVAGADIMSIGGVITGATLNLVAVGQLLDSYGLAKILAQPVLVSLSGQKAEFLAGGETPIPQVAGLGGQVNVTYKPFGVNMVFVPTVLANNVIDVRLMVEISEISPAAGINVNGITVPGFTTRKAATHLRVESGKTFAVAGLLRENTSFNRKGIPGLGRLPLLGIFFRNVAHTREETEVVIYVTPRLVRPLAAGEVPPAPGTTENNNPSDLELFILGTAMRPGSRTAEPTGVVGLQR